MSRRVRAKLPERIKQHPKTALAAFIGPVAVALLVIVLWPGGTLWIGGAPIAVPIAASIAGVLAALVLGSLVPWLLYRSAPYFHTREDVERVLRLPVLATHPHRGER